MEWLALRTDLDTLDEGDEYVTLMTVHTAKGLEFPVVFVAGLEESIFPHAELDVRARRASRRSAASPTWRSRARASGSTSRTRTRARIYGSTQHNPPSRFIGEIPAEHVEASGVGSRGHERHAAGRSAATGAGRSGTAAAGAGGRVFGGGARRGRAGGAAPAPHASAPKTPTETFEVGDAVDHKAFGRGRVVEVNGDELAIRFERTGETKKLLVGYAPIVKIKQ